MVKYDGDLKAENASFYRTRIESRVQNVRGVDVVSYSPEPNERLLLIEIKDYRVSEKTAENDSGNLRQTVVQKALNTLSGLYAAARIHDVELYTVAAGLFRPTLRIEVILFLERPPLPVAPVTVAQKFRRQNPLSALENLDLQLTGTLAALGLEFQLRDTATMRLSDGWTGRS